MFSNGGRLGTKLPAPAAITIHLANIIEFNEVVIFHSMILTVHVKI